jgi:DNA replication initiation complex subunit (GINS family)
MYKRILEFWMNEKELRDLQQMPPNFAAEVRSYLKELEESKGTGLKMAEAERVRRVLGEIAYLRRDKMCQAKVSETKIDFTWGEEEKATAVPPSEVAKDSGAKKILVRLLGDVASFVGADLKTYGPFKSEDVVLLPAQNAEALIKRAVAAEIQKKA